MTMNESPSVPRQGPARRREQHPVAVFDVRTSDCAAKHLHLVTEHGVLKLELPDGPSPGELPNEAHKHDVGEGSHAARMLPTTVTQARSRVLEPDTMLTGIEVRAITPSALSGDFPDPARSDSASSPRSARVRHAVPLPVSEEKGAHLGGLPLPAQPRSCAAQARPVNYRTVGQTFAGVPS